jgi:hypothetical protein
MFSLILIIKLSSFSVNEIISLLISSLNIHLNLDQNFLIKKCEVFMWLEKRLIKSLSNIKIRNGQISIPLKY